MEASKDSYHWVLPNFSFIVWKPKSQGKSHFFTFTLFLFNCLGTEMSSVACTKTGAML